MATVSTSTNLSSVAYVTGEVINIINGATLTINSTPSARPGSINCITSGKLSIVNNSLTDPIVVLLDKMSDDFRFESNGILEVRGQMIELSAGNGLTQVWNLTSIPALSSIPDVTYIEVETLSGSNVYNPWPILEIDPLYYAFGKSTGGFTETMIASSGEVSEVFFFNNSIKQLKTGNGINGSTISEGRRIRIPNVYISNNVALDASLVHGIESIGTPTGGTFTITAISRLSGVTLGTTAPIAFNATAAVTVQALTAVLGSGTVTGTGGPLPTAVTLTLAGIYAAAPLAFVVNSSVTGGTNSRIFSRENSAANLTLIDLNPSGTLDCECVSFSRKIRVNNTTFSNSRCLRTGFGGDGLTLGSTNASLGLSSVHIMLSPYCSPTTSTISNIFGGVDTVKVVNVTRSPATGLILQNLPNLNKCEDVKLYTSADPRATSAPGLLFNILPGITITRPVSIGARMRFANLARQLIISPRYADDTSSVSILSATGAQSAISFENAVNMTVSNFQLAGSTAPRNYAFTCDSNCQNIEIIGGNFSGGNNTIGIINPQQAGTTITNFSGSNLRGGPSFDIPTSFLAKSTTAKKVVNSFATNPTIFSTGIDPGQDFIYDVVSCPFSAVNIAVQSIENYVGGNFVDAVTSPTSGSIVFGPFYRGTGMTLEGAAYTDQLGSVIFALSGDRFTAEIPFAMHAITNILPVSPRFYMQGEGIVGNSFRIINEGGITSGSFNVTIFRPDGSLVGTTAPIAYNATTTTFSTAISNVIGANPTTTGSLAGGYISTFPSGSTFRVSASGTALAGGTQPGVVYAHGRARMLLAEGMGSGLTIEYQAKTGNQTSWPDTWNLLTNYNLSGTLASLTNYNPNNDGLNMRVRVTRNSDDPYSTVTSMAIFTEVNPTAWEVGDASIKLNGPNATDVTRIVRLADSTILYSFTGNSTQSFTVGDNFGTEVFLRREDNAGVVLMRTLPATQKLIYGYNGEVDLYYGAEVQLAESPDVTAIKQKIDLYLDAAISSRLPTTSYTAPDNATIASIKVDTNAIRPNTGLIPALL